MSGEIVLPEWNEGNSLTSCPPFSFIIIPSPNKGRKEQAKSSLKFHL